MCILCVIQRWSRRVATMLPWLVIPFIVLWGLSQLLPPALRFEITSPRLACVAVLLATLFWYEILMPQLSGWRTRRAARLRERRRAEALELQKLRKTATRHCRNCHTPYRNQTPCGGRFLCSYCGHISKKPVLDLPVSTAGPGLITDLVGKHAWLCDADGNCNLVGTVPTYWTGIDHRCSTYISYSGVMAFSCKLLSFFSSSMRWLLGKFFRFGSSKEDISSDSDHKGSSRKGEISGNFQESREEKARRKAEEKRQARLKKEMMEEEERKQKEEVARLVEERRKLRDEKMVAEKGSKGSSLEGDGDGRKEIDRRRGRRKDKDRASCRSNSVDEELEKRTSRESERKQETMKKGENENFDLQKSMGGNYKSYAFHGSKAWENKPRYFDGMKGSLISSSRGFGGSSFFGRNTQKSAAVAKSVKPSAGFIDHAQNTVKRRDAHPVAYVAGKSMSSAFEKAHNANLSQPAATNVQQKTGFKTSWKQLFTRSSAVFPHPDSNSTTHVDKPERLLGPGDQKSHQNFLPSYGTTHNQVQVGQASPFMVYSPTSTLFSSNPISHNVPETTFSPVKELLQGSVSEDAESFENSCYVPAPISLLGPVSDFLDNFPLDLEAEFSTKTKAEQSPLLSSVYASAAVNKPSPNESPLSMLHVPEQIHTKSDQLFCITRSDVSTNMHEQSTWQMWSSPWAQEGLGVKGCPANLFSPVVHNNSHLQDVLHSLPHKPIMPPISKNHTTQRVHTSNHQPTCGTYSPLGHSLNGSGMWRQNSPFRSPLQVDGDDRLLPSNLMDAISLSEATYSSPNKSTAVHAFETHQASSWSKDELASYGPQEAANLNSRSANVGSLFSRGPDAPSVWSFNQ
ncbi:hypothetical protein KFK09_012659 [Dendrobium nobile]|uniref:Stress response NST1-like protein n=1 Tax=Dendrobium nobile TaxID=94219 RepID=A0A8T3BJU8_DENNO|nr:hypothetical protein KFK09_012659 [Dendrobium nobile]